MAATIDISLQHRPAEELIPLLKPMLKPEDGISGEGFSLFIRTDAKTYTSVRALIAKLDKPAQRLLVYTRIPNTRGRAYADTVYHYSNKQRVTLNKKNNIPSNKTTSTQQYNNALPAQAGKPVLIYSSMPGDETKNTTIKQRIGQTIIEQPLAGNNKVYAIISLLGENEIIIDIQPPEENQYHDPVIRQFQSTQQLRGQLGEWLTLNTANTIRQTETSTEHKRVYTTERRTLQIKVEQAEQ